ncbi:hypothetical protein T440DRAFT_29081 [Plenodomus tracheiphilus IPT5]|uniref:Uncharacterized protein n=1 Tax=Plenodomus tracheiphilus IPT5 TaxID=1408161 RepID=A0A6A7BAC4_9PLEO|nr:hypothetical protein T440DRAFT_29081 [Plenodomus tracheiphilus IPT5]
MRSKDKKRAASVGIGLVGAALTAGVLYVAHHAHIEDKDQKDEQQRDYYYATRRGGPSSTQRYLENNPRAYHDESQHISESEHDSYEDHPIEQDRSRKYRNHRPSYSRHPTGRSDRSPVSNSSAAYHYNEDDIEIEVLSDSGANDTSALSPARAPALTSPETIYSTGREISTYASAPPSQSNAGSSNIASQPPTWQWDPANGDFFYDSADGSLRTWRNGDTRRLASSTPEAIPGWKWDEVRNDYYIYSEQRKGWHYFRGLFIPERAYRA